ncbi:MAG: lysophospholipid acyltransferase family protein [Victivallaceae bacterium]
MGSSPGLRLFSFLFYVRFTFATVIYCLFAGIPKIITMPFISSAARHKVWRNLIRFYGKFVIKASSYPFIKVEYYDLAPNEKSAGVVVANHRSGSDAFMFGMWPGDLVQIAGEWPFKLPFFGVLAKCGGYYNISKIAFDDFISRASDDILKNNVSVVGFPEGTRSVNREMGQFHGALFRLAVKINCPVYPFLILGTEKVVNRQFMVSPGFIRLYKLPAVSPERFAGWTPFQLKVYVKNHMTEKIAELEKASNE